MGFDYPGGYQGLSSLDVFDGIPDFMQSWARLELPKRKREEGPVSFSVSGAYSTLYSYSVPIAAWCIEPRCYFVRTDESLQYSDRTRTTLKHVRWARRALTGMTPLVTVFRGRLPHSPTYRPQSEEDWGPFLLYVHKVRPPTLSAEAQGLWSEYERTYDEQLWRVLFDMYAINGFGERIPISEWGYLQLEPNGFHLVKSPGPSWEVILR